jgi:hypothetical protein
MPRSFPAPPGATLLRLPAVLVRDRTLVGVPPTGAEVEHLMDEVVLPVWRAARRGAVAPHAPRRRIGSVMRAGHGSVAITHA